MTDNIGLYVMGFMLAFGAICWVASVVCAWLCEPKQETEAPYKVEPQANYLADCEWPEEADPKDDPLPLATLHAWNYGTTEKPLFDSENTPKNHHKKDI